MDILTAQIPMLSKCYTIGESISIMAWDVYTEYLDVFHDLFKIGNIHGIVGGSIPSFCHAEWEQQGEAYYRNSVMMPLRNAFYSAIVSDYRWDKVYSKTDLKTPFVDYGCGVGWLPVYLRRLGIEGKLYGWELPNTPQHKVMTEIFKRHDIGVWDGETPVETIVCNQVLEHLEDPEAKVTELRSKCNQLYSNCDDTEDPAHIAPMDVRYKVQEDLKARGEFLSWK